MLDIFKKENANEKYKKLILVKKYQELGFSKKLNLFLLKENLLSFQIF